MVFHCELPLKLLKAGNYSWEETILGNMVLWFQCIYWDCNLKRTLWWKEECSSHHICMNFLKRVKSIVVPEFLLYDFFFHVKSCPISGSVADPALTGTRATTLFSKIVPTFCRLGINISIQKLLYFSLSNFRFAYRPRPYRQLEKKLCILVPWIVSKKQLPKKAQKDFTKVKIVEVFDREILIPWS